MLHIHAALRMGQKCSHCSLSITCCSSAVYIYTDGPGGLYSIMCVLKEITNVYRHDGKHNYTFSSNYYKGLLVCNKKYFSKQCMNMFHFSIQTSDIHTGKRSMTRSLFLMVLSVLLPRKLRNLHYIEEYIPYE